MGEFPRDPSPHELRDYIERVERKVSDLQRELAHRDACFADLNKRHSNVAAWVDDLVKAFHFHSETEGNSINQLYELVWALMDKVFPGYRKTQTHINAVIPSRGIDLAASLKVDKRREDRGAQKDGTEGSDEK